MSLTIAMSDIHGCYDQMIEMIETVNTRYLSHQKKFVFVGDYCDRGPDTKKVFDYLMASDHVCIMGNHEEMMLTGDDMWLMNGGTTTAISFDGVIPQKYYDWCKQLPYWYEDDQRIYVHAGIDPYQAGLDMQQEGRVIMEHQRPFDMTWIRGQFLNSGIDFGKLIVHGHSPASSIGIKPNRINIDTGGVFGNKFTAAVFEDGKRDALEYIQVKGWSKDK
jgi:serine/threonine protein phosphatase 1